MDTETVTTPVTGNPLVDVPAFLIGWLGWFVQSILLGFFDGFGESDTLLAD